mmetsp:Transcript_37125/g.60505  ORF Transcript_37125/g.60505 Transcript_37125/m.60505 type:complete len:790 (-) Transcript_37125:129-2498(-)
MDKKIGTSNVSLSVAEKKGYKHSGEKTKAKAPEEPVMDTRRNANSLFAKLARDAVVTNSEDKKSEQDQIRKTEELLRDSSIILFDVPNNMREAQIKKKASKIGRVNLIEAPMESYSLGESMETTMNVLVIYTKITSANTAVKKLSGKVWAHEGNKSVVMCRRFRDIAWNPQTKSKCRLIIRNLPFKITEKALLEKFTPFGPVLEVSLAKKDEGEEKRGPVLKGFGFVHFACRYDAQRALDDTNGKELKGRPIAVDWAMKKSDYDRVLDKQQAKSTDQEEKKEEKKEEPNMEVDEGDESDSNSEDGDDSSDSDEESDKEEVEEETPTQKAGTPEEVGLTLFVRNILFETTEDELYECFKKYGGVRYAKIAKGRDGRSRGTGFVNFYKGPACERALKAASEVPPLANPQKKNSRYGPSEEESRGGMGISLAGRPLFVTPAVERTRAKDLVDVTEKEKNTKTDKRHLYLAREGIIMENDGEVELPKTDRNKRERAEKEKKTKLKSPLFFVSPTRLSVRNLFRGSDDEPAVSEQQLRKELQKAANKGVKMGLVGAEDGDPTLFPIGWPKQDNLPPAFVRVCRLMCDEPILGEGEKKSKKQKGRSKGYGFVEFSEHVHALAALRLLNNNPEYAALAAGGPKAMSVPVPKRSRLVIEFTVENASKIQQRKKKLEKNQQSNFPKKAKKTVEEDAKPKGKGDGKKGKEDAKKGKGKDNKKRKPSQQGDPNKSPPNKKVKEDNKAKKSKKDKKPAANQDEAQMRSMVEQYKKSMFQDKPADKESKDPSRRKRWFDIDE